MPELNEYMNILKDYRNQVFEIKRVYKPEMQKSALKDLANEISQKLEGWKSDINSETEKLQYNARIIKPKENSLDPSQIATLQYYSQQIKARVAAQGNNGDAFASTLEEFVKHEDPLYRQAFVDHYHEFQELAQNTFKSPSGSKTEYDNAYSAGKSVDQAMLKLRGMYDQANESLKTPEQKAYDSYAEEVEEKCARLSGNYSVAERLFTDLQSDISNQAQWQEVQDRQ
jgi:hypothetical protein